MDTVTDRPLEEQIRYEVRNQVAWITIDRPERGNALPPEGRDRIRDLVNGLNHQLDVRAAVITASGEKMFCPGADISMNREPLPRPDGAPESTVGEARRMMLDGQHTLMPAILDCDKPIIAAVNGTAAGMGAHLALMCDLVIMAEEARMIEIFARRALVPDALGTWILPRLVGLHKAKELMFFADDIPAAEALRIGLVNRVVPRTELMDAATEWAERLASGPTKVHGMTKQLLNRSLDVDRQTITHHEAWMVDANLRTEDFAEGMASFRERRDATYKGW